MTIAFNIDLFLVLSAVCNINIIDDSSQNNSTVITINSEWFDISYLDFNTYVIEEPKSSQANVSYLLIGDTKAIMFDTGSGENQPENGYKIKPIIDQIVDLPVTLLLSHFHFDHNQNIAEFSTIGFPDLPFLRQSVSVNDTYKFTAEDLFAGNFPSQVKVNEWFAVNTDIDLGNRIIQLVNVPGHTKESIAIIDKTNKMVFLGDFLYNGTLFLFNTNDLLIYKKTVDYLISILSADFRLFGAHGTPEVPFKELEKLKNFLVCIKENNCQSAKNKVWGYDVIVYEYDSMKIVIFQ